MYIVFGVLFLSNSLNILLSDGVDADNGLYSS